MGSGTVPVEAALMGIDSIGIDASPFCTFMADTKLRALTMQLTRTEQATKNHRDVYNYFSAKFGEPTPSEKIRYEAYSGLFQVMEEERTYSNPSNLPSRPGNPGHLRSPLSGVSRCLGLRSTFQEQIPGGSVPRHLETVSFCLPKDTEKSTTTEKLSWDHRGLSKEMPEI